jgi:hypothetical protein
MGWFRGCVLKLPAAGVAAANGNDWVEGVW